MKVRTGLVVGILAVSTLAATGCSKPQPLPDSIKAYLAVKDRIPQANIDGLSVCKLLARNQRTFYALPSDVGPNSCDLSKVILAYNGWCTAGVEDSKGVHFSKSYLPYVTITKYDGGYTVVYLNNYLKTGVTATEADRKAATMFFTHVPSTFDIRGEDRPLFPKEYDGQLPPKKKE